MKTKILSIKSSSVPHSTLTYLIGNNNPINGFRPAATYTSRRLCCLRAYTMAFNNSSFSICSFERKQGRPPADLLIKYSSRWSILIISNNMAEPAQPLDINTQHNVYVVEDRRSYVGKCLIGSMPLRHKETRVEQATSRVAVLSYDRYHTFIQLPILRP